MKTFDILHRQVTQSLYSKEISEFYVFQRLKNISQLGPLKFKYINADHSRFNHSIGVSYLAYKTVENLQKKHPEITFNEIIQVEIAGLLHDIGHSCFSHTFDSIVNSKHEERSVKIVEYIIKNMKVQTNEKGELTYPGVSCLTEKDITMIQYFIDPVYFIKKHYPDVDFKKEIYLNFIPELIKKGVLQPYFIGLEQIVNNQICQIDVDKIDYIYRDKIKLTNDNTNYSNLILNICNNIDIIDNLLCFSFNFYDQIDALFRLRQNQYVDYYNSDESLIYEHVIKKCMEKLKLNFSCVKLETENDFEEFFKLTDDYIINLINDDKDFIDLLNNNQTYIKMNIQFVKGDSFEICDDDIIYFEWKTLSDKSSPENIKYCKWHTNGKYKITNETEKYSFINSRSDKPIIIKFFRKIKI